MPTYSTYRCCGSSKRFGAVCWQPRGVARHSHKLPPTVSISHVVNIQPQALFRALHPGPHKICRLPTYTPKLAPTNPIRSVGPQPQSCSNMPNNPSKRGSHELYSPDHFMNPVEVKLTAEKKMSSATMCLKMGNKVPTIRNVMISQWIYHIPHCEQTYVNLCSYAAVWSSSLRGNIACRLNSDTHDLPLDVTIIWCTRGKNDVFITVHLWFPMVPECVPSVPCTSSSLIHAHFPMGANGLWPLKTLTLIISKFSWQLR